MMNPPTLVAAGALVLVVCAPALGAADADAAAAQSPRVEILKTPGVEILVPYQQTTRPAALPVLYATLVGLQAYDGWATTRGAAAGAPETNPLVGGLAQRPVVFWTIKAVSTAATIYFAEQLWRQHHRTQAVIMLVATNGAMGAIAARNASILSRR